MNKILSLNPIGIIRSSATLKFDAPHQPDRDRMQRDVVELFPKQGYEQALEDLSGFDHIWLVWWFDRNTTWRPKVLPPRGSNRKRGVFATRSPHRPNPIGLTCVPLLGIEGRKLFVGSHDLIDGTPILDIKPYLTSADCFPTASNGWLAEVEKEWAKPARYSVTFGDVAREQRAWLEERGVNLFERALPILERDPTPHRTRRIVRSEDRFRMGCGAWRIFFALDELTVKILEIAPGYPEKLLRATEYEHIPHRDEQLQFLTKWK